MTCISITTSHFTHAYHTFHNTKVTSKELRMFFFTPKLVQLNWMAGHLSLGRNKEVQPTTAPATLPIFTMIYNSSMSDSKMGGDVG